MSTKFGTGVIRGHVHAGDSGSDRHHPRLRERGGEILYEIWRLANHIWAKGNQLVESVLDGSIRHLRDRLLQGAVSTNGRLVTRVSLSLHLAFHL